LDIEGLESLFKSKGKQIETFGYKSKKLNGRYIKNTYTTAHSRYFNKPVQIIGVSPSLFDAFKQDFINVNYEDGSNLPLSEQLYSLNGAHSAGIGTNLANQMHVFTDQTDDEKTFMLNTQGDTFSPIFYYKVKTKFILDSAPALKMGKRVLSKNINIVISIPDAQNYIDYGRQTAAYNLMFQYWFVKLNPNLTKRQRKDLIDSFRAYGYLQTIDEAEDQLEEVRNILDVIFNIIIALSMFLCLFSLISSTSANMMEQTKEIGVLRAIGYTKYMIKRLYFYETFVLVFASSWLGIMVGTFVGWTMTVQQAEFISIPILFFFPYKHLIATGLVSVICSFVAVYSPTSFILSRQISEIFRIN
jgi:ABC-type antimicrobial peptide transport system permease subunit